VVRAGQRALLTHLLDTDLSRLLNELDPADLRQRIADLDRERSAWAVLLRTVATRQLGRERAATATPDRSEGVRRAD
jgi:hypothetical protein